MPDDHSTDDRELWFTPGRHAFFLIPRSEGIAEGSMLLRAVRGGRRRTVEEEAVAPYQIPGDEAVAWVREDLHVALDAVRETVTRAAGDTAEHARSVGGDLRDDLSHLEESLAGVLSGVGGRVTGALKRPGLARALDGMAARIKDLADELRDPDAPGPAAADDDA